VSTLRPWVFRGIAWTALLLLLLNPGCPVSPATSRPLVLLDGSLSMAAAGARWAEASEAAKRLGEVRLFGDPDHPQDSLPRAGASQLAVALSAASATGRPVVIVTDGEITDGGDLPAAWRERAAVRLFERARGPAAAIRSVQGPPRVTERDSIRLRVELVTRDLAGRQTAAVSVREGRREVARGDVALGPDGRGTAELALRPGTLSAGDHVLAVGLADSLDAERRDDERLHLVAVSPTPGVVMVASPVDWDARFLLRTLRDVSDLPVEGYAQLETGRWRRMSDLQEVDGAGVRRSVLTADLVVLRGASSLREAAQGRALLDWPSAVDENGAGDWYVGPGRDGPLSGALAGAPLDSFPPANALAALSVSPGDWIGLMVQLGRRGAARPAMTGGVRGSSRVITIGAQGLWRWAFRGGSSEQAYRALVAGATDWLLAAPDSARGRARPLRAIVPQGQPVLFTWTDEARPSTTAIEFRRAGGGERRDSLRFDGNGTAPVFLDPGIYTYGLDRGGRGTVAVETWSDEWYPRPVTLAASEATVLPEERRAGLRDRWWLFGVAIAAWCAEWFVRRRMGLR
jgi:hypothetical protein